MKTVTVTQVQGSTGLVAPPATKETAKFAITPQGIRAPIYGFIIGLLANKRGKSAQVFLSRAKAHHKGSGKVFPRIPFSENIHSKMTDSQITEGLDSWIALLDAGQGRKVAGSAFSQALYDAYRVIQG